MLLLAPGLRTLLLGLLLSLRLPDLRLFLLVLPLLLNLRLTNLGLSLLILSLLLALGLPNLRLPLPLPHLLLMSLDLRPLLILLLPLMP